MTNRRRKRKIGHFLEGAALLGLAVGIFLFDSNLRAETDSGAEVKGKLSSIIVPKVEFQDTPLHEALRFLQKTSFELDAGEKDPARKGVQFLLLTDPDDGKLPISFKVSDASLGRVLSLVTAHARLEYKVSSKGALIVPPGTRARDEARAESRRKIFVNNKLKGIILPSVEFQNVPLREALQILEEKSAEFDTKEPDPSKKGIRFVVRPVLHGRENFYIDSLPYTWHGFRVFNEAKITLKLQDAPLATVLKYTVSPIQVKYKAEPPVVRLYLSTSHDEDSHHGLLINRYVLPAQSALARENSGNESAEGPTAKDLLIAAGVTFTPGTSVTFNAGTSELVVRNTWDQMERVESFVKSIKGTPVWDWH